MVLEEISNYVISKKKFSKIAYDNALLSLADSLGCAMLSLNFPECTKLLGPLIKGTHVPHGSKVPGTPYILDPVQAAFNIGAMIRWLDYNDTWLAKEWGHPSDNLGGLIAVGQSLTIKELLDAMIKTYEIQGVLALENSFNALGLDHVILVKVATAAVVTHLLGGNKDQVIAALSQAWIDGGPLRTYRHAPNTGSRKSWAAGDATSRGVFLAHLTMQGEMGYPKAMEAKKWGVTAVLLQGKPLILNRPLDAYVMENILFKVSFPAEFHAQTAVECALKLYPQVKDKWAFIEKITIETQKPAMQIIDKKGPLNNPADRDHCLQYMVAVPLLLGELDAKHYHNPDPRIDPLRKKMEVRENPQFSKDYLDPEKRSIANSLQIHFTDGSATEKVTIEYPLGHKRRREEAKEPLYQKLKNNTDSEELVSLFKSETLMEMPLLSLLNRFPEKISSKEFI